MLTYPQTVTAQQYQHSRISVLVWYIFLGHNQCLLTEQSKILKNDVKYDEHAKKNLTRTFPYLPATARREFATSESTISGTIFMLNFN